MFSSSGVDVVTAATVGGRGWAGGGTGVLRRQSFSGVDVATVVGWTACADVDLSVTAVGGRAGDGAGVAVSSGVDVVTAVGGVLVLVPTSTSALSEEQLVAVLVVVSTSLLLSEECWWWCRRQRQRCRRDSWWQ